MSTPAVTVYINGDSAQLGEELGKAIQAIRDAGGSVEQAATKFSMLEARGSVQLLASEFGVHVPREISRMIAAIPGIGVAMEGILPAMAAVWAVVEIEKYITKMREAEVAVSEGLSKALEATTTRNDELKVSIAETQLKIDKLLGKPISGDGVALEIAKARVEADKLAASLNTDLNEYIKLMDKASHGSIMAAIIGTHTDRKKGKDPRVLATPMSIPLMRGIVTTQPTTLNPTVATAPATALAGGGANATAFIVYSFLSLLREPIRPAS